MSTPYYIRGQLWSIDADNERISCVSAAAVDRGLRSPYRYQVRVRCFQGDSVKSTLVVHPNDARRLARQLLNAADLADKGSDKPFDIRTHWIFISTGLLRRVEQLSELNSNI